MRYLITIALALALTHTAVLAAEPDTVDGLAGLTASFQGRLELGEEGPSLPFRGTVTLAEGFLRVSVTQDLTLEEFIALVDYEADTLTLLYPDTLNGKRYQLSAFDHLDGFSRIRSVLQGKTPEVPEGWELTQAETECDGVECTHFRAKSLDGDKLDWWVTSDNIPVKALLKKDDIAVLIEVTECDDAAEIDPGIFTISGDYAITDSRDGVPDILPSL